MNRFYQKKNNLFQSVDWKIFRKSLGEEIYESGDNFGIELPLPFNKKFIWFQKGPEQLPTAKHQLPKDVVFVRMEPEVKPGKGYKKVESSSLLGGQRSPRRTRIMDLAKSEEELLAEMKSKTRYNIRLAEKRGVRVAESDNVDDFYKLLQETSGRDKGYHPHQKNYYVNLVRELRPKGLVKLFIAYHENTPIAGIMVTFYGEIATYLHGGFSEKSKNLMAPYLCQWTAIRESKAMGCKVYDFWGVAETGRADDPWAGITRFKEGFGGEVVEFPGTFDFVLNKFWYNIFCFAAKVKKVVKR